MKITGEYMGKRDEMLLKVVQKEQNRRLITRQTEGPFQKLESTQEFQSNGDRSTLVIHTIDYESPPTGKIANFLSGSQAENKIRQGIQQAAQTVKQKLESVRVHSFIFLFFLYKYKIKADPNKHKKFIIHFYGIPIMFFNNSF